MKTIILEVDDESGSAYYNFSQENKKHFLQEVTQMMRYAVCDARIEKLRKINDEINNDPDNIGLSPEILLELLWIDESWSSAE